MKSIPERLWISDRRLNRLKSPLGVLVTLGAMALFCGFFVHSRGFVAAAAIAAVAALGGLWPWLSVRAVEARLRLEPVRAARLRRGREGEPVRVVITLRNRLPWAIHGLALRGDFAPPDAPPDERDAAPLVASVAVVRGRATVELEWEVVPEVRGRYPHGTIQLACAFPFGLWTARRPVAVEAPLIVWPRPLDVGPLPDAGRRLHATGTIPRDIDGGGGDLMGVRAYRRGDSLRRVHWAQTARHDRLIVSERQSVAVLVVSVAPDLDPAIHTPGPRGTLENVVRATVGVVERATALHADVFALLDGRRFDLQRDPRAHARWLDALALHGRDDSRSLDGTRDADDEGAGEPRSEPGVSRAAFAGRDRDGSDGLRVIVTSVAGRSRLGGNAHNARPAERWIVVLGGERPEWTAGGRALAAATVS